ncbi:MAG TPA: hypothetical protein VNT54_16370 [Solirubrobacteraceae bacterium]|nr:hypothetical protein [Solirubrobacteraceae bacterium]
MLRPFRLSAPAGVLLVLLAPAVASADTYVVTSCTDPAGQPNAAAGWVAFTTPGGVTLNTCAQRGGALVAALPSDTPPANATANWRFDAPLGTRIVRVRASRTTTGLESGPPPQAKDIAYDMVASEAQVLEDCTPGPLSSCVDNLIAPLDRQGLNGSFVQFRVLCTNAGLLCTRKLGVVATHLWTTLEDPLVPVVANNRVIDDGEASGILRVRFDAADAGGGLYRTLIKVDGKIARALPLGPPPCNDVYTADLDPYQFSVPAPCPRAVTGSTASLDVRSLAPGPHGVEIAVEDAAGNQTSVAGPVEFPKPNVGVGGSSAEVQAALRGRLRMWFVKSRTRTRRSLASRFGTRVVTRGVLRTRSGRGIVGARIDVYHIRRDGKRRLVKTGLKTRAGGALTLILPNNVDTRTIEYAYRALRPGPITSRQRLRLTVRTKSGRIYHRKSRARR